MATLTMQQQMQEYFAGLNEAEQKQVLEMAKALLNSHNPVREDIDLDEYNRDIDEALAEVANGNFITQADVEAQSALWGKK